MNSPVLNYRGTQMRLNYVWLRDHCRSASSYNSQTNQRNLDTCSIDLTIRPDHTSVEDDSLVLTCKCVISTTLTEPLHIKRGDPGGDQCSKQLQTHI